MNVDTTPNCRRGTKTSQEGSLLQKTTLPKGVRSRCKCIFSRPSLFWEVRSALTWRIFVYLGMLLPLSFLQSRVTSCDCNRPCPRSNKVGRDEDSIFDNLHFSWRCSVWCRWTSSDQWTTLLDLLIVSAMSYMFKRVYASLKPHTWKNTWTVATCHYPVLW